MKKLLLLLTAFFIADLTAWSYHAQAADPLCDNDLWTQIVQRGRLNGQQDQAEVENFVYKADSILEYTCFNRFMTVSANKMTGYLNPQFINNVIQPAVTNWINSNYGHTSLGGRANPELTFDNSGAYTAPDYSCDVMKTVWQAAKCLNVDTNPPYDNLTGVYEFLTSPDERALPAACTAPDPADFGVAPVGPATTVPIGGIPKMSSCGNMIPTGYVVDLTSTADTAFDGMLPLSSAAGRKYNEYICANPVCTYVPTGLNTGDCEEP
jgi:hypothetical protein